MRIVVVLPAPLGPRKPKTSPRPTLKSMLSTATRSPKRLVRPRASISAPGGASAGDGARSGMVAELSVMASPQGCAATAEP
jgi:hypothetical protein